ncbi:MAG: polymer-forming cytoskeletal protein [Chloroflexota bacterium]
MFRKDKVPPPTGGKIENVLGPNTTVTGTLKSDGNSRIDGVYKGRIEIAGNLIVGPSARVLADIVANTVQVWGAVRGDIRAQGRLEILPSGRVWGNVQVSALSIDEGGVYRGVCTISGEDVEPLALPELEAGEPQPGPVRALPGEAESKTAG